MADSTYHRSLSLVEQIPNGISRGFKSRPMVLRELRRVVQDTAPVLHDASGGMRPHLTTSWFVGSNPTRRVAIHNSTMAILKDYDGTHSPQKQCLEISQSARAVSLISVPPLNSTAIFTAKYIILEEFI